MGQSKMDGGKNVEKGSGHGMAKVTRQANTACRTMDDCDEEMWNNIDIFKTSGEKKFERLAQN